jgi:hypothetical protein
MSSNGIDRCEELQSQLAAYALGEAELDPELIAHLARCADCWRTLHAYAQVARTLPYTAPQALPAPELRERILAAALARPKVEAAPASRSRWIAWPRWRSGRAIRMAATFAVLLGLLGWNIALQSRLATQSAQIRRLSAQVATSRESWQTMTRVLNSSDLRAYELSGRSATGRFWASPQTNVACLVAEGLPDPGSGNVYRVWLMQNSSPVAVGSFVPQAGSGWALLRIDQPLAAYQSVDVTLEPRNGGERHSGQQVLKGSLASSAQPRSSTPGRTMTFKPYAPDE